MSKKKVFSVYAKAIDDFGDFHYVTVVGVLEQKRVTVEKAEDADVVLDNGKVIDGKLTYKQKKLYKKLTVGMSICHPMDEFDEKVGIKIARSRIKEGKNLGVLETYSPTMLTNDAVEAELLVKLAHICSHIEWYIY